jgi:hypothetical protein
MCKFKSDVINSNPAPAGFEFVKFGASLIALLTVAVIEWKSLPSVVVGCKDTNRFVFCL